MSPAAWLDYAWGNCTRWVAQNLAWIPAGLGNAKDWLANAQAQGLPTGSVPLVGSAAVYGAGHGYDPTYGHVAEVIAVDPGGQGFTVSEMNATAGFNQVDTRHSTLQDVEGFIYQPGTAGKGGTDLNPLDIPKGVGDWLTSNHIDINPLDMPKGLYDHLIAPAADAVHRQFQATTSNLEHALVANLLALVVAVIIIVIVFSGEQQPSAPQTRPVPVPVPV